MNADYFDDLMLNRQRLLWAVATRRQLERWEPLVAAWVRDSLLADRDADGNQVTAAEIEHHFALVAARNLLRALDLSPPSTVPVEPILRAELIEGRDLLEHWPDNLPIFNVAPRIAQPRYPTGKAFAARNHKQGPYWWLGWAPKTGAQLMPHASAPEVRQLLDAVEADALARDDGTLANFVPPRTPSPWHYENGEWWPKADGEDV